jgi:hypothetical protein
MKKIYAFFMVYTIVLTAHAQLVFNENFTGLTNGNLGTQGSWVQSGSGTDVQVSNVAPLLHSGYTSGTQYVTVSSENGTDPHKLFSADIPATGDVTVYLSFVVRVDSAQSSALIGNDYSITLYNTGDADRPLRFYIAEEPDTSTQIRFGLLTGNSNNASNIAWTSVTDSLKYDSTYLIVIRYDLSSAPGNQDDAYLWVNPVLTSEPSTTTANVTLLNANEANFGTVLNALEISQSSDNSPDASFDAFRVAYGATSAAAWTSLSPQGAALPVVLTSFNAIQDGLNNTKLIWNVAQENGIVSYVVQKSLNGQVFTDIGIVNAASQKTYSFTDIQPSSDYTYYRLKIMETDGGYKLSYIVSVKSRVSLSILISPNPVKSMLTIQHPKATAQTQLQIMNSIGELIKEQRLSPNAVISTIDMSAFASGLYHVVFKNGKEVFIKTVVKQ